ncbi:MAG: hypothetical protein ACREXI_14475 [Caldimonas sp.]
MKRDASALISIAGERGAPNASRLHVSPAFVGNDELLFAVAAAAAANIVGP